MTVTGAHVDTGEWQRLLVHQGRGDELRQMAARRAGIAAVRMAHRMAEDNTWHVDYAARCRRDRRIAALAWLAALATVWVAWETAVALMAIPLAITAVATVCVFAWRSGVRVTDEQHHVQDGCPRRPVRRAS